MVFAHVLNRGPDAVRGPVDRISAPWGTSQPYSRYATR
jgi:hypothetical protein